MMGWIDLIVRPGGCAVHRSEDFFICLSSFFHAVFLWRCQGIRTYGRGIRYVTHEKGADAYAICFGPAALPGELFYTADEYRHRFLSPRPLKPEEERVFLEQAAQGDMAARNKLIEHNLRLVAHIVNKR